MNSWNEAVGNMHMHTPYSDGEYSHGQIAAAAIQAGLDFVIVTDHNIWIEELEGYYENEHGRVLLLVGEEVHNVRRVPQASHFLVYGAERELATFANDPQRLINEANASGGYGFLAHPHEKGNRLTEYPDLGWHDWDIEGYTGLELWNYMSSFVSRIGEKLEHIPRLSQLADLLWLLPAAFHPEKIITKPETETLALWDSLLAQGKQVAVVGNSDAHGTLLNLGPLKRIIFPYDFLFRAINTHLITPEPLSGDYNRDKEMILNAIGRGHSWVGYDMAHPTRGFRFTGQGRNKGIVGDQIHLDVGATLQVSLPAKARIRMIRHGTVVAEANNDTNLTHIPFEEGAYRVECLLNYRGQERGWIYSNPIYLV